jgi:hypothetical protein
VQDVSLPIYPYNTNFMIEDFRVRYIYPIHLSVLHGNFVGHTGKRLDIFLSSTKIALDEIDDREFSQMYNSDWRAAMTASWLCGIGCFSQHSKKIETLLIPSKTCYAGALHCFALARFDNTESVRVLRSYLDIYLPIGDRCHDQLWAIGALRWLDCKHGTDYADFYLENPDNWKFTDRGTNGVKDPEIAILHFPKVMDFVARHFTDYC